MSIPTSSGHRRAHRQLHLSWALTVTALFACDDGAQQAPGTASAPLAPVSAAATATASGPTQAPAASSPTPETSSSSELAMPLTGSASASALASTSAKPTATTTSKPTATAAPTAIASAAPTAEPTQAPTTLPPPAPGSAEEVAFNVDNIFKDKTRYKASFVQKFKQKISGKEREQKGTVYIERPGKISFRYDAPNKNRIVSDGTTLKLYVAEDSQMFEHPVKNTEYPGAFGFIMGNGIRPSFNFTFNDKAKFDLGKILIGTPKTKNPQYEQVLFYIDTAKLSAGDPSTVSGVLILDAQGNKNRFELHSVSFPDKIDPSEFQFTAPPGTNITK